MCHAAESTEGGGVVELMNSLLLCRFPLSSTIEKCSPDTALRDITDLSEKGILQREAAGGRSTSYVLVETQKSGPSGS
jgi:Fic family protein